MKLLDRYVLRELIMPFLIGTIAVVLMFDINLLMYYQKTLDLSAVPHMAIAQLLLDRTPGFLEMTLPVGTTLAASLGMSRLARESELTAMRAAGAPILRVIAPIALFGLFAAVANFLVVEKLMPISEARADSLERQIGVLVASPNLAENAYVRLEKYQVSIGRVTRVGRGKLQLQDILLFSRPSPGVDQLVSARNGWYVDGQWTIRDASVFQVEGDKLTLLLEKGEFPINERISVTDLFMPPTPTEMSLTQLRAAIQDAIRQGRHNRLLEVQYYVRFSVPASCIIFAFVAPAFAVFFARSGFAGVLLSIFLVFLYYNAHVISTEILGNGGVLPPMLAAWLPNIVFGGLGLFAIRRLE